MRGRGKETGRFNWPEGEFERERSVLDRNKLEPEFEKSNCALDRGEPKGVVVVELLPCQKANPAFPSASIVLKKAASRSQIPSRGTDISSLPRIMMTFIT